MKDKRLDDLFREYRDACEYRDANATFMPGLWRKIEKAQNISFVFRRWAKGFVTASAVLSLLLAMIVVKLHFEPAPPGVVTYLEALSANNSTDGSEYIEIVHPDNWDDVELL